MVAWSDYARHVIICVENAFPSGTIARLEAAEPAQCFEVIDQALDAGEGSGYLKSPVVWRDLRAEFVSDADRDYAVLAYHIAPTHAHVLIREAPRFSLEATVERWKAVALTGAGDRMAFGKWIWAPGYYDQILCDVEAIEAARVAIDFHGSEPPKRIGAGCL